MLIGFTGRIAAGKGVLIESLKNGGFEHYHHSNEVRKEAASRGLQMERSALQDIGNEIRRLEGASAWTKRLIKELEKDSPKNAIVDGIRNPAEVVELKRKFKDFILISIDAPQRERFQRILKRARESDPKDWEGFLKIDLRDLGEKDPLGQQVGECMKLADFKIINDSTLEELQRKFEKVLGVVGV